MNVLLDQNHDDRFKTSGIYTMDKMDIVKLLVNYFVVGYKLLFATMRIL